MKVKKKKDPVQKTELHINQLDAGCFESLLLIAALILKPWLVDWLSLSGEFLQEGACNQILNWM